MNAFNSSINIKKINLEALDVSVKINCDYLTKELKSRNYIYQKWIEKFFDTYEHKKEFLDTVFTKKEIDEMKINLEILPNNYEIFDSHPNKTLFISIVSLILVNLDN